jgi:hypothetical protein
LPALQVFGDCHSLTTVIFEAGSQIEAFDPFAFYQCTSLESICVPGSVRSLSASCFRACCDLRSV